MIDAVERPAEGEEGPRVPPVWHVISRLRNNRLEVFTLPPDGRTLPVFECEREARAFLESGGLRGWRVRETTAGELISLLFYLCDVENVVRDPSPDLTDAELEEKREFVTHLLDRPLLVAPGN